MAIDPAWIVELLRKIDKDRLVWLLYLSARGRPVVTKHDTSNYEREREKVQTFAKRNEIQDIDVKRGFDRLNSSPVDSPFGRQPLCSDDKSNNLLRATDAGQAVLYFLIGNPAARDAALRGITAKAPPPDPPFESPHKAPVQMKLEFLGEPGKWKVTSTFRCERCQAAVSHSYEMEYPLSAWNWISVVCTKCKQTWTHLQGEPNRRPIPADS